MLPPGKANPLPGEVPATRIPPRLQAKVSPSGRRQAAPRQGASLIPIPNGGTAMNRRPITFIATAAAILLIAVGVASCGGTSGSSSNPPAAANQSQAAVPNPAPTPVAKPAKQPAPAATPAPQASAPSNGIPQGDVGDNDSDNHGGPDDGDGGI